MEERLQKIIARAGVASRRDAELLIQQGLVTVNGQTVTELGAKADAAKDHIKVKGRLLQLDQVTNYYVLLNKPKGVVSTVHDPEGRITVTDMVKGIKARLYPVGRLDVNTEGALLLTNDGELTNQLLAPASKCPKIYVVKVFGTPSEKTIQRLQRGLTVEGTRYNPCEVEILKPGNNTWVKVVLFEGKNLQIRKMFEVVNHPVSKLKRIAFAFLTTNGLAQGEWRELSDIEISRLKDQQYNPLIPINPLRFLREFGVEVRRRPAKSSKWTQKRSTSGKPKTVSRRTEGGLKGRLKPRGEGSDRPERAERRDRSERGEGGFHSERGERGERSFRGERSERGDRRGADRSERGFRGDRSERGDRRGSERRERSERGYRGERSERGDRRGSERGERSERGYRGERSERGDRREYGAREGRPDRRDQGDRDDRRKSSSPKGARGGSRGTGKPGESGDSQTKAHYKPYSKERGGFGGRGGSGGGKGKGGKSGGFKSGGYKSGGKGGGGFKGGRGSGKTPRGRG